MTLEDARNFDPLSAYLVSKAEAGKAAFSFVEKKGKNYSRSAPAPAVGDQSPQPKFTIATLTPLMVYRPFAHHVESIGEN